MHPKLTHRQGQLQLQWQWLRSVFETEINLLVSAWTLEWLLPKEDLLISIASVNHLMRFICKGTSLLEQGK